MADDDSEQRLGDIRRLGEQIGYHQAFQTRAILAFGEGIAAGIQRAKAAQAQLPPSDRPIPEALLSLLHEVDGMLGLVVYRNQRLDKEETEALMRRVQKYTRP